MGHSPSIQEMQKKETEFRNYLNQLQADFDAKSEATNTELEAQIATFYSDNEYDDVKDMLISVRNDGASWRTNSVLTDTQRRATDPLRSMVEE